MAGVDMMADIVGKPFERVDWFPFEQLKSSKLNKQAGNQTYLLNRKTEVLMQNVSPDGQRNSNTPAQLNDDIIMYSEYRDVETGKRDEGELHIEKNISFPDGFFVAGTAPVTFCGIIYHGEAKKQINSIIKDVNETGFVWRSHSLNNNTFDDNAKYSLNVLALSPTDLNVNSNTFSEVDWGGEEEKLQITSAKLNQMVSNTAFINQRKVSAYHKNVDSKNKDLDPDIQLINDRLTLFGGYEEFSPDAATFNKHQNTNDTVPKKFTISIDFPELLFDPRFQPIVIANVGPKNAHADGSIKKINHILKKVTTTAFTIEIREYAPNASFETNDVYFCSYTAVGVALLR